MIHVYVTGQKLTVSTVDMLVQNSANVYECDFTFDSAWDGFEKTAVFKRDSNSSEPVEVALNNSSCSIPNSVLSKKGRVCIGVYGTKNDIVYPTIWGQYIDVVAGTPTNGATEDITPSKYDELRGLIDANTAAIEANTQEIEAMEDEVDNAEKKTKYRLVYDETQNGSSVFDLQNISLTHAKVIIKIPKDAETDKKYAVVFSRSSPSSALTIAIPIVPFVLDSAAPSNLYPRCDMDLEHGMWEQKTTYPDLTAVSGLNKYFVESYMQQGILFKWTESYFQNPNYGTQHIERIQFVEYTDDDGYGYPRASANKVALPNGFEVMIYGIDDEEE